MIQNHNIGDILVLILLYVELTNKKQMKTTPTSRPNVLASSKPLQGVLSNLGLTVCQQNHDNTTTRCKNSDCDMKKKNWYYYNCSQFYKYEYFLNMRKNDTSKL